MAPPENDRGGDDVLSSLPATRPQRRSARRSAGAKTPRPAADSAAPSPGQRRTTPKPAKPTSVHRGEPKAVRPSAATKRARETGRAKSAAAPAAPAPTPPQGIVLVATAVQAAGELAHIGLNVGAQALRGALSRLPRP